MVLSFASMGRRFYVIIWLLLPLTGCVARRPVGNARVVAPAAAKPVPAAPPPKPLSHSTQTPYLGEYVGSGVQDDGTTWPLQLTVLSLTPGHCANVVYPKDETASQTCTAEWLCTPSDTPGVFEATERLISGKKRCLDNCRVFADLPGGIVRFECKEFLGQATIKPRPLNGR